VGSCCAPVQPRAIGTDYERMTGKFDGVAQARHKKKPVKKTARASAAQNPSVWERTLATFWILLLIVIGAFCALPEPAR